MTARYLTGLVVAVVGATALMRTVNPSGEIGQVAVDVGAGLLVLVVALAGVSGRSDGSAMAEATRPERTARDAALLIGTMLLHETTDWFLRDLSATAGVPLSRTYAPMAMLERRGYVASGWEPGFNETRRRMYRVTGHLEDAVSADGT